MSQIGSDILSTHIPFVPCQSTLPFLRYGLFKIRPCKSKINVIGGWKAKVIQLVQHPYFCFVSIGPTIPMILPIVCFSENIFCLGKTFVKSFQQNFSQDYSRCKVWLGYMAAKFCSDWIDGFQNLVGTKVKSWALRGQCDLDPRSSKSPTPTPHPNPHPPSLARLFQIANFL